MTGLGCLTRIRLDEAGITVRQADGQKVRLACNARDHGQRLTKVGLAMAGWVRKRHEHLLVAQPPLVHVVFDDGLAPGECVLRLQPLEDALGRVTLLLGNRRIGVQHLIDDPGERIELRTPRRLCPAIPWRHRVFEHLAHRVPVHTEPTRRFPDAHSLDVTSTPHPCVQLH